MLPGESQTRLRIDLNGEWSYAVTGGSSGTVQVPSAYDFEGKVVFQRILKLPADVIARYQFHLVALGISQYADVTINNDLIAGHYGGYTAIDQKIPDHCLQSETDNVIRIVVNNTLDAQHTFPLRPYPSSARNYGGITRDIYLLGVPRAFIRDASIAAETESKSGALRLRVNATVDYSDTTIQNKSLGCYAEVLDKISGIMIGRSPVVGVEPGGTGGVRQITMIAPVQGMKRWSPDNPDTYLIRCNLVPLHGESTPVDVLPLTWGLREFSIANGNLMLNGSRFIVNGVIWNEEHPAYGNALSFEQMEKDVALIKTLGANAIRFAGHPPHPYMLDLCDRYGIVAFVDLPLTGVPGPILQSSPYHELASLALREMITQNRNHPSVIAWGIGDWMDVTDPATRDGLADLVQLARSLDTRFVYSPTGRMDSDLCTGMMDLAALNIPAGDVKVFRSQLEAWKAAHPDKPVIVARFGTEVQEENRHGSNDPLSQESQARFYLQRFDILHAVNYDGGIVSSFNDWYGARASMTVHSGNPWLQSMGLVNGDREKRLAFDAVRAAMHGEKFAALPLGAYSNRTPIVFVLSGFAFLVGMVYLYNRNRRFRETLNRSILSSYNFFADIRDHQRVAIAHTLLLGLGSAAGFGLMVSSLATHFRESRVADVFLSLILVLDSVKAFVVRVVWEPLTAVGLMAATFLVILLLITGFVLFVRVFFRQRVSAFQALTVTFWSSAPLLLYIPFGMIAYRVMESDVYVLPFVIFFLLLLLWAVLRLMKGLSIVFDIRRLRMYFLSGVLCIVVLTGVYVYYDSSQALPDYVVFLYHIAARTV